MKAAEQARRIAAAQRRIDRWEARADRAADALREAERQVAVERANLDWLRDMPVTDGTAGVRLRSPGAGGAP